MIGMKEKHPTTDSHGNNFNLVRLIGAMLVMLGHMGPIMGATTPVMGQDLHGVGVEILFLIGGYLIAQSWMHDPNLLRYGIRRFFRLWPSYAVMILLMTFVTGPLISNLGFHGYFGSWWTEYLKNLRFFIVYAQPGVFEEAPMPYVTNGSLWTMPVEAVLYFLTPFLLLLFGIRRNRKHAPWLYGFFLLLMMIGGTWLDSQTELHWIFYGTDWTAALRLSLFFLIGIFCSLDPVKKVFRLQWVPLAFLAVLLVQYEARAIQYFVMLAALPYMVFSLALAPNPIFSRVGRKYELSYGIYLYGFFFQQLVMFVLRRKGIILHAPVVFLISLALTLPAAWLNCVLVERPVRHLVKRILSYRNGK